MSYKLASYLSLLLFFAVGLLFFVSAQRMPPGAGYDVGPGFFPSILSALMMGASVIGAYTTWRRREDQHVDIPKPVNLAFTMVVAVGLLGLWFAVGRFYLVSFIAVTALLYVLNPEARTFKKAAKSLLIGGGLVLIIYVVFGLVLNLRF